MDGMSREELDTRLMSITEVLIELKTMIKIIDDRQREHYEKLISVNKEIEFLKEKECNRDRDILNVWDGIHRRDRGLKWAFGLVVTAIAPVYLFVLSFFIKN